MWGYILAAVVFVVLAFALYRVRHPKTHREENKQKANTARVREHMFSPEVLWPDGFHLYVFMISLPLEVRSDKQKLIEAVAARWGHSPGACQHWINRINYILVKKLHLPALFVEQKQGKA